MGLACDFPAEDIENPMERFMDVYRYGNIQCRVL